MMSDREVQRFKAAKERPLKSKSIPHDILKLANPVVETEAMEATGLTTEDGPLAKKMKTQKSRSKRTQPKPRAEEAPPRNSMTPELTSGIRSTDTQESDDDDLDLDNYRRFSARLRKKPDFFSISHSTTRECSDEKPHREVRGIKRKRRLSAVRRSLFVESASSPDNTGPDPVSCGSAETKGNGEDPVRPDLVKSSCTPTTPNSISPCNGVRNHDGDVLLSPLPLSPSQPAISPPHSPSSLSSPVPVPLSSPVEQPALSPPSSLSSSTPFLPPVPLSPTPSVLEQFPLGMMVWGKIPGYDWWPGSIISHDRGPNFPIMKPKEEDQLETSGGEGRGEGGKGRGGGGGGGGRGRGAREDEGMDVSSGVEKGGRGDVLLIWVKWFGENNLSQVSQDRLAPFSLFAHHYHPTSMKGIYKKAVITALKEAARRCKMEFISRVDDRKPRWVITESNPEPQLIKETDDSSKSDKTRMDKKDCSTTTSPGPSTSISSDTPGGSGSGTSEREGERGGGGGGKGGSGRVGGGRRKKGSRERGTIVLTSLEQEMVEWAMKDFQPVGPQGLEPTPECAVQVRVVPINNHNHREGDSLSNSDDPPKKKSKVMMLQIRKKARFDSILEGKMKMKDLCIGCGDMEVVTEHPLFEGGLCRLCKETFMEFAYLFDDDGTQMYCCICSEGENVFMCDANNCAKVYCSPCIEKLCGISEVERVTTADPWLCYMCSPKHHQVGLLKKREDWDKKLQELFMTDHEMEYEPPPSYPPIPPEERKPIRVLGLFDGIGTGLLVLKELGFEVELYIASEIDSDAVKVSRVKHKEIIHVGNISEITEKEVKAWGPFDLVMGGSPCNDLSIVNPARKGIYEGTGRLFFEFFRLLTYTKPAPGEQRPFFWLYENVVSMRAADKQTISRFLQCNPVVVDAREISAAHRARYFWGNIPGMNRPTIPLRGDRLILQECLEPNCFRTAQFVKLRTITTKMNSIKQTKKAIYPVRVAGETDEGEEETGDVLWCTEMERLFGFPDHYTDVANLGRCGRQRLLGKAWSVPVIRHILSPLKDYFMASTTLTLSKDQPSH